MFQKRLSVLPVLSLIAVLFAVLWAPVSAPAPAYAAAAAATYSGTLAAGEYHLYTVDLIVGDPVTATMVCDEIAPGNRPLDPLLKVYFPGSDPTDSGGYDLYGDDEFGTDDDPSGVDCNSFDSARVIFTAPVSGTYTFRVQDFWGNPGPYTLTMWYTLQPGCDVLMPRTDTAVVGAFVADTPLYYEPGVPVSPALTMTAGKTAWVLGVDPSGQYYRIIWVCSYVYVPTASMGPNYDAVWQGRALPTGVVQATGK